MEKRMRNYETDFYVDGNTVRRMEAAPERRREQEERRKEEERRRKRRVAEKNQQRAAHMNRGYVVFLTLATVLIAGTAVLYVNLQSSINVHMNNISSLEGQVADIRTDNDATEKRLEASVDIEKIRNYAVNSLGMVYANADQIVHYTIEQDDYMNQYEDVPEK